MFARSARFLHFEGFVFLVVSLAIYGQTQQPWWWMVVALLAPDFALNRRVHEHHIGRWVYDAFHTYPLPSLLTFIAVVTAPNFNSPLAAVGMAWFAHIGLDRLLGRGACYAGRVVDDLHARAALLLQNLDD